jgi:hypothetical protein
MRYIIFPAESVTETLDFSLKPPYILIKENAPRTV